MANNISQFWFAWVGNDETTFNAGHQVEDELIFSFNLTHEEGQFATLDLEIRNPRIGLLNVTRPIWAWFSFSDGTTVTPLFYGRLVGVPGDLLAEVVTINLIAKPIDYVDQRAALAASLKVLPYFDPIFIDPKMQDDPDAVLEGYSRLYHVDRATGLVTTSDLIVGEDGLDEFTPSDIFYDSVHVELGEAPLLAVEMAASTHWVQTGGGSINLGNKILSTYTSGLNSDWPKIGAEISGGYVVLDSYAYEFEVSPITVDVKIEYRNEAETHSDGDTMSVSESFSGAQQPSLIFNYQASGTAGDPYTGTGASVNVSYSTIGYKYFSYATRLVLGMNMEQARTENVKFTVTADLQPILTEPDEKSIVETLSLDAQDVVAAGAGAADAGSYFATDRGLQSLEYLMLIARAHLLAKARVVKITWDCRFPRMVNMSCRKNASIEDRRLPGGIAIGKIVNYVMEGTGDSGEFIGHVTINSAIGYGNAVELQAGTPDYVAIGYVDAGYQHYSGTLIAADTADISYAPPAYPGTGLQNPLSSGQVLVRQEWNDAGVLEAARKAWIEASRAATQSQSTMPNIVATKYTMQPSAQIDHAIDTQQNIEANMYMAAEMNRPWLEIELKPITGIEVTTEYLVDLGKLVVPQQIDLAATSTPGG